MEFFVRGFGVFNNSTLFKNVLYLHQALLQIKHTAQRTMAHLTLPQTQYHICMATYSSLALTCSQKSICYLYFYKQTTKEAHKHTKQSCLQLSFFSLVGLHVYCIRHSYIQRADILWCVPFH